MAVPDDLFKFEGTEIELPINSYYQDYDDVEILVGPVGDFSRWHIKRALLRVVVPSLLAQSKNEIMYICLEPHIFAHIADWILRGGGSTPYPHHANCFPCSHQVDFCKVYEYAQDEGLIPLQKWALKQFHASMGEFGDEYLDMWTINWLWNDRRTHDALMRQRMNQGALIPILPRNPVVVMDSSGDESSTDEEEQKKKRRELSVTPSKIQRRSPPRKSPSRQREPFPSYPKSPLQYVKNQSLQSLHNRERPSLERSPSPFTQVHTPRSLPSGSMSDSEPETKVFFLTSALTSPSSIRTSSSSSPKHDSHKIKVHVPLALLRNPARYDYTTGPIAVILKAEVLKLAVRIIKQQYMETNPSTSSIISSGTPTFMPIPISGHPSRTLEEGERVEATACRKHADLVEPWRRNAMFWDGLKSVLRGGEEGDWPLGWRYMESEMGVGRWDRDSGMGVGLAGRVKVKWSGRGCEDVVSSEGAVSSDAYDSD